MRLVKGTIRHRQIGHTSTENPLRTISSLVSVLTIYRQLIYQSIHRTQKSTSGSGAQLNALQVRTRLRNIFNTGLCGIFGL